LPRVVALLTVGLAATLWAVPAHAAPAPWCGGDARSSSNRLPDLQLSPNQIRVVYATPSDGPDDFAADAPLIAADVAAIDAWWRVQDPTRAPRWDLYPFAGCAPGFAQLDISFVRLASPGASYLEVSSRTFSLVTQLLGATNDDAKTLVYYDGPVGERDICGTSGVQPHSGGAFGFTFVWLAACESDLGQAGETAHSAAHELLHDLGAEPDSGPPHACPAPTNGHPCDSPIDILYPYVRPGEPLASAVLDAGRDDYYAHSGSWWDVQDSDWLARLPQFPLTVASEGSKGRVVSGSRTVSCPVACSLVTDNGAQIELTAVPAAGSRFVGWKGACSGRGACVPTMDGAKTLTAVFGPASFALTVAVSGRGKVIGGGVSCSSRCSGALPGAATTRLRAKPAAGYRLAGWGGDCHGVGSCTLAGDRAHRVTARFARA
jgi:hypothetical protein